MDFFRTADPPGRGIITPPPLPQVIDLLSLLYLALGFLVDGWIRVDGGGGVSIISPPPPPSGLTTSRVERSF